MGSGNPLGWTACTAAGILIMYSFTDIIGWCQTEEDRVRVSFLIVTLAVANLAQAADSTQPAGATPGRNHPRLSADGCEFPEITQIVADEKTPKSPQLAELRKLLMHDPASLGFKVFNAHKSADALNRRLAYFVPGPDQITVLQTALGPSEQVTHTTTKHLVVLHNKWFATNVANADICGIDLDDGVVSSLCLVYQSKVAAGKIIDRAFPAGLDNSGWHERMEGSATILESDVVQVLGTDEGRANVRSGRGDGGPRAGALTTPPGLFASGSGFFITPDGYFLTNKHVAGEEGCIFHVRLEDGREKAARVVVIDDQIDIALMHVDVDKPTPFLKLSAADFPNPAAEVMTLGYPGGSELRFKMQVATGDVTSVDENDEYPVVLTLNTTHGNSGGPIIDKDENVVGILSAGQQIYNASYIRAISVGQIRKFLAKVKSRLPMALEKGPSTRPTFEGELLAKEARQATLLVLLYHANPQEEPNQVQEP